MVLKGKWGTGDVTNREEMTEYLVHEIIQKATQCHNLHFCSNIQEKYRV